MFAKYRNDKLVIIDSITKPEGCFEVPKNTIGGLTKEYYNDDYTFKSMEDLIKDGVVELKDTQKVYENRIIDKTDLELMTDGLKEIPTGFKLEDGKLISKTNSERLEDGEITQDEYDVILDDEKDANIVADIRAIYSINEEAKCLRLGILDSSNTEFVEYNKAVESIKEKYSK